MTCFVFNVVLENVALFSCCVMCVDCCVFVFGLVCCPLDAIVFF